MQDVNVIVDVQGSFCRKGGELEVAGTQDEAFLESLEDTIAKSNLTIYTLDTHGEEYAGSQEAKEFKKHCDLSIPEQWNMVVDPKLISPNNLRALFVALKSDGIEVPSTYHVEEDSRNVEVFVPKDSFNVWVGNRSFKKMLVRMGINKSNSRIIISGVASDYCVREAAIGFKRLGFDVNLNHAGCRGIVKDSFEVSKEISTIKLARPII